MILINNYIITDEILTENFSCNIEQCKGICCVEGDSGAPLTFDEVECLKKNIHKIYKYLSAKSIDTITKHNFYYIDVDNEPVTQLNDNKECVFAIFEKDIVRCAIQKAYVNKDIEFSKPASCALYPLRIKKYKDFVAVNIHRWDICKSSFEYGKTNNISLLEYCKDSIINHLGEYVYEYLKKLKQEK
ncbi:MAG: DUF3109 family protein [Bacteroidales bacterium]|nr:DUF3109 family protein [Bacteroidales bacterium]